LVPFHMTVRPPRGPALPWLSRFPEYNVRTYARGVDGQTGIWFLSLDAGRLPPVLAARAGWGLPYFWSRMGLLRVGDTVRYACERTWPPPPARLAAEITAGAPIPDGQVGALDHFLTARFVLWAQHLGQLRYSRADHPRWPLRRATVNGLRGDLVEAAGLPTPEGPPMVHFSEGVDVRVGRPHRVG
jgi:uncharacterized protein